MIDTAPPTGESSRIRILDITPAPPEDLIVAIALALDRAWPDPQPAPRPSPVADSGWRFAGRPWSPRAIPLRRWGRS